MKPSRSRRLWRRRISATYSALGRWSWLVSGWAFNSGDFDDLNPLKFDDFKRPVNGAEEFWNSRHKLVYGCFIVLRVGELNDDTMEDHGMNGLSLASDGMFFMVMMGYASRSAMITHPVA